MHATISKYLFANEYVHNQIFILNEYVHNQILNEYDYNQWFLLNEYKCHYWEPFSSVNTLTKSNLGCGQFTRSALHEESRRTVPGS